MLVCVPSFIVKHIIVLPSVLVKSLDKFSLLFLNGVNACTQSIYCTRSTFICGVRLKENKNRRKTDYEQIYNQRHFWLWQTGKLQFLLLLSLYRSNGSNWPDRSYRSNGNSRRNRTQWSDRPYRSNRTQWPDRPNRSNGNSRRNGSQWSDRSHRSNGNSRCNGS